MSDGGSMSYPRPVLPFILSLLFYVVHDRSVAGPLFHFHLYRAEQHAIRPLFSYSLTLRFDRAILFYFRCRPPISIFRSWIPLLGSTFH